MKNIAIVILNYNGSDDTIGCLESLLKVHLDSIRLSILVVDNGSDEFYLKKIRSFLKNLNNIPNNFNLRLIENNKNLGFAEGNNVGIKEALANHNDYIMLLNNDTVVDKNFLKNLLEVFLKNHRAGIVVPKIYFYPGFEFHKDKYKKTERGKVIWYAGGKMDWKNLIGFHIGVDQPDKGQYEKSKETEFPTGCCMLVKAELFNKIGFLDNKFFLYYEESDFAMRTKKKDFKIIFAPKAVIWHKNATSSGGSGSKLQDYYIIRNRLLFGLRYAPFRTKLALIKESIKIFLFGRYWQKKGILDFYLGKFSKGSFKE